MMEIINFLGHVNNPEALSIYLKKMFEGVKNLMILPDDTMSIYGIKSIEGEVFRLRQIMKIRDLNAEKWIIEFEQNIKDTIKLLIFDAYSKETDFEIADRC